MRALHDWLRSRWIIPRCIVGVCGLLESQTSVRHVEAFFAL
jgi:hypothetical protein